MDVRNAFFYSFRRRANDSRAVSVGGYNSTEIGKTLSLKPGTVPGKTKPGAGEDAVCVGWEDIL